MILLRTTTYGDGGGSRNHTRFDTLLLVFKTSPLPLGLLRHIYLVKQDRILTCEAHILPRIPLYAPNLPVCSFEHLDTASYLDLPHLTLTDSLLTSELRLIHYYVLLHRGICYQHFLTGKTCLWIWVNYSQRLHLILSSAIAPVTDW